MPSSLLLWMAAYLCTVGDAPILNQNTFITQHGTIYLFDLLAGVTDPDGDSFILTSTAVTTAPSRGTLGPLANSQLYRYLQTDLAYTGSVSISYTVTDATLLSTTGSVTLQLAATTQAGELELICCTAVGCVTHEPWSVWPCGVV